MDYACTIWRSAPCSHVWKLQVLQSKCLCIAANAPWCISNRQIHEDLGIPFLIDHIRASTESFKSKLADARNPLVWQLGKNLCLPRAVWSNPRLTEKDQCSAGQSRLPLIRQPSWHNDQCLTLFGYPDWGLPCFTSVVRKMTGYNSKGAQPAYPQSWRPLAKMIPTPPSCRGHQPKRSQPLWVQLPNIHPTKVLFAKDKLPNKIILPPVAITPSWTCQGLRARQLSH
jgi:hypothetical protein